MLHELATGRTRLVHGDWDRSADGLVWSPDSAGLFGAIDDAGTRRVYFLPISGAAPVAITQATNFDALSIADDGTLVARNQSFVYPPRVVRVNVEAGAGERLETFNDEALAGVDLGTYESVTYTGAEGAEIQMWVHYPPGFDPERKYPLFLLIHGGPHGAISDMFHFRWNAQTFSSWGYVTAWHNFHGSSGFGQDFTDSINPDWMTKPYADTIAAAEWFTEKPWIDTERMVAGGGSYGGYLSTVLLGRDHPFNALVIHAAVYDLYAQTSADFAVHDQRFGPYWENPELYRAISPHYFADAFDTPSLIIAGQKDLRVPVGQAFELFRTLQTRGVESRLVYYPDENHWVLKPDNSLHWYGQVRDWVERFAEAGPQNPPPAQAEARRTTRSLNRRRTCTVSAIASAHGLTRHSQDRCVAHAEQRVHDLCLVRASQGTQPQALDRGGAGELGHRAVRVSVSGAGQPDRLHGAFGRPAEAAAGSHHPFGLRAVCAVLSARTAEAGLSVGSALPGGRGLFCIPRSLVVITRVRDAGFDYPLFTNLRVPDPMAEAICRRSWTPEPRACCINFRSWKPGE